MALETGTFVTDLNVSNPTHTDGLNQADSHMRLIKTVLQNTFPGLNGPMLASPGELNAAGAAFSRPGEMQVQPGPDGTSFMGLNGTTGNATILFANNSDRLYIQILSDQGALIANQAVLDRNGTLQLGGPTPQLLLGGTSVSFYGMITLFSGLVSQIPPGWHLCDGTNGTPNLIDRFVVCAGLTYNPGDTGGIATQSLSYNQLPAHIHGVNDPGHNHGIVDPTHSHGLYDAGHSHYLNDPGHNHEMFLQGGPGGDVSSGNQFVATSISANTGGTLYSAINQTGATVTGSYTGLQVYGAATGVQAEASGTGVTTQPAGNGAPVENRPPYMALCYIMRIA